jgi:hypothetical protein
MGPGTNVSDKVKLKNYPTSQADYLALLHDIHYLNQPNQDVTQLDWDTAVAGHRVGGLQGNVMALGLGLKSYMEKIIPLGINTPISGLSEQQTKLEASKIANLVKSDAKFFEHSCANVGNCTPQEIQLTNTLPGKPLPSEVAAKLVSLPPIKVKKFLDDFNNDSSSIQPPIGHESASTTQPKFNYYNPMESASTTYAKHNVLQNQSNLRAQHKPVEPTVLNLEPEGHDTLSSAYLYGGGR